VPGTTAWDYSVSRGGEVIGTVRFFGVVGAKNRGEDPMEYIARHLNGLEDEVGFDSVASALSNILEMY
jgi:hypothetical protein